MTQTAYRRPTQPRIALLAVFCLGVPVGVGAQTIHKCTTPTATVYQSFACDGGQMETLLDVDAPPVRSDPRAAPDRDISHAREWTLLDRRPVLRVGMSDDEILNLPHWGRPTRITRSKGHRAWREQWVYESFAEVTRRLYFVNGKLTALDTEPG